MCNFTSIKKSFEMIKDGKMINYMQLICEEP